MVYDYLNKVICKDALEVLKELPDQSVNCVITSPPYFGLRNYMVDGQLGLEQTPEQYVEKMVEIFNEAKRVLCDNGTLWLNLGDSYVGGGRGGNPADSSFRKQATNKGSLVPPTPVPVGYKPKDLLGIPFQIAFALQSDGWYWRSTIPWVKRNAMPESVKDRPTSGVEYVFMFSKSQKYYYDYRAVQRPLADSSVSRVMGKTFDEQKGGEKDYGKGVNPSRSARKALENFASGIRFVATKADGYGKETYSGKEWITDKTRRYRNTDAFYDSLDEVIAKTQEYLDHLLEIKEKRGALYNEIGEIIALDIPTRPFKAAHFATFPTTLIEPLLVAGCPVGGVVLDFFCGSGTTGVVAQQTGRYYICSDLNPEYVKIAQQRIAEESSSV